MDLNRLDIELVVLEQPTPKMARGSMPRRRGAVVAARVGRRWGLGEIAPLPGYSPESLEQAVGAAVIAKDALLGVDIETANDVFAVLDALVGPPLPATARFGLESAILDAVGWRGLGHICRREVTNHTLVGGEAPNTVADAALAAVKAGSTTLKVKLNAAKIDDDIARLRAVRDAVGPDVKLRVDVGGRWSPDEAESAWSALAELAVELVEQPVATNELAALRALRQRGVLVAADEGCRTLGELDRLIRERACDVVVLKPAFIGSLRTSMTMGERAARAGLGVIVTGVFDLGPGAEAARQVALRLPALAGPCGLSAWSDELVRHRPLEPTIPLPIVHRAQWSPDRLAVCDDTRCWSWKQLGETAHELATTLSSRAVLPGDVVVLDTASVDGCWFPIALWGIALAGAIPALLPPKGVAADLFDPVATIARNDDLVITEMGTRLSRRRDDAVRGQPTSRVALADIAVLLATSGSTGEPRVVPLSWQNLVSSASSSAFRLGLDNDDNWLQTLPPHHTGGLSIFVRAALYGISTTVVRPFDATRCANLLSRGDVTLASFVPTMLARVLDELPAEGGHGRLRAILVGGGPATSELLRRAREAGLPVFPTWGMTEAASQIATGKASRQAGDCGLPLVFTEVVERDGELLVRSPTIGPAAVLDRDGWLHTGDLGSVTTRGVVVDSRRTDLIVTGGENVSPRRVSDVLASHPGVVSACVVGLADPDWGQRVAAVVVTDDSKPDQHELSQLCRQHLAPHEVPRQWAFWSSLPLVGPDKIDIREVREVLEAGAPSFGVLGKEEKR